MNEQSYIRRKTARQTRYDAADTAFVRSHEEHPNNGEERPFKNIDGEFTFIANFSKGLRHNKRGEVEFDSYKSLLNAIQTRSPADFESIILGKGRKLVNPQAGIAYDLEGPDSGSLKIRPAPKMDSAEAAGEMVEDYWMALARDVSFSEYQNSQIIDDAVSDMSSLSDFRGPKNGGSVTADTLFRGNTIGDLKGPFLSQFLLLGNDQPQYNINPKDGLIKYGTLLIDQQQTTVKQGIDYMTKEADWLDVQNGLTVQALQNTDPKRRFIRSLRDLANYVHFDALYQAYLNAALYLLSSQSPRDLGNPYNDSITQEGFGTFGDTHLLSLVTEVATRALKAVWFQKWFVHRRLRPEEFGGRIHFYKNNAAEYPIHSDVLNSEALVQTEAKFSSYLLPQAFPEGGPTHPAYGAGHATVAGACVTILKAWFDESAVIENPVESNKDGTKLVPYQGCDILTVGEELDKLAANISLGRNAAGVHYRTDYTESINLGEAVAMGILEEQKLTYNESHSFSFNKFDGIGITI